VVAQAFDEEGVVGEGEGQLGLDAVAVLVPVANKMGVLLFLYFCSSSPSSSGSQGLPGWMQSASKTLVEFLRHPTYIAKRHDSQRLLGRFVRALFSRKNNNFLFRFNVDI